MNKRLLTVIGSGVALCLGAAAAAYADHRETTLRAQLRGLNEVPPTASRATGELRAVINGSETQIDFTLSWANLSGNLAAAHIHFGPTKVNGGVMVFFCGGGTKPPCPTGTSGTVSGTLTSADVVGPTPQGIPVGAPLSEVVRAIKTGNGYANLHTQRFENGEIRGQIFAIGVPFAARIGDQ